MQSRIFNIRHIQADNLLREYIFIRYELGGAERTVALAEWATRVDRLYLPEARKNNDHLQ